MAGGGFDGGFGAIAHLMVKAAGVAKAIGHGIKNFLSNSRIDWGGSVVVKIDHELAAEAKLVAKSANLYFHIKLQP